MSDGRRDQEELVRENEALRRQVAALQTEAERFKATLYSIGDAVIGADADGNVLQMNPVAEVLTGWSEVEAKGRPTAEVFKIVNEETRSQVESPVARVLREGTVVGLANHTVLVAKNGTERPIADSGAPIRNEKGEVTGVVLVFRDQTTERATQKALRESEVRNRTIVASIPQRLFLKNRDGAYLAVNEPYATSLGSKPEQVVGKNDFAFYPAELADKYRADDRAVMESGRVKDIEERYLSQGKEYWVHTIKAPVVDDAGEVTAVLGLFEDITERKRVEDSLKDARDRLAEAQRAARLGNWEWDALNDEITGSEEFCRLFDVAQEGLARFSQFIERLHPDDRERVQQDVADALKQDRPYDTDYRVKLRDNGWRDINARGRVFTDLNGKVVRLVGTCLDITERKRVEVELRVKNQVFEDSIASQSIADKDGVITHVNPAFLRMWGYATKGEAIGKSVGSFFKNPEDATPVLEALAASDAWEGEFLARRTDGTTFVSRGYATNLRDAAGELTGYQSTNLDVTRARESEAALRESEERNRATLYSIGDAVISVDTGGKILQMNPVAEALTGWSQIEATGQPLGNVFRIINEETRADVESPVDRVLREGVVVGLANHTLLIAKDGTERPIADSGAPIRNEKGEITGVVLVFRDQTEERRHEAALRESAGANLLQAELLRNAPVIAAFHDRNHNIVWANRAYEEATGLSQNEIVGRKCYAVWHLATPCRGCPVAMAIDSGVASEAELTPQNQDHWPESQGYWLSRAAPVRDENGKVIGAIEMAFDIGDRKQAEEALAESEKKYRTLFETMSEGIVYENHDGTIVTANPAAERLLGLSLGQLQGRTSVDPRWKAIHEDGSPFPGENHSLYVAAKTGKPATGEIMGIYNPQSDTYVWLSVNSTPEFLPGETTPVSAYAVFRDITDSKRAEQKIRTLNADLEQRVAERTQALEESNKELEAFSYSVSHDLRAPLRAIDGFAHILSDDYGSKLDDEARRVCAIIRENTSRMGRLIDDLLTFSRLGRTEMQPSEIDMGGMARAVYHEVTTPEHRARIDLQLEMMPTVVGDPSLMRQVWMNLLGNAVKFSSKRERIVITVSGETKDREKVFSVRDNGAGFDMQYVGKLFGVFQRLHSSKEFEGTGVGLALVQRVIRRHGGRVWAEGEPDRGATFYFALPQKGT